VLNSLNGRQCKAPKNWMQKAGSGGGELTQTPSRLGEENTRVVYTPPQHLLHLNSRHIWCLASQPLDKLPPLLITTSQCLCIGTTVFHGMRNFEPSRGICPFRWNFYTVTEFCRIRYWPMI